MNPIEVFISVIEAIESIKLQAVSTTGTTSSTTTSYTTSPTSSGGGNVDITSSVLPETVGITVRDLYVQSFTAMNGIIDMLVVKGGSNPHLRKALICLKTLYDASMKAQYCILYNEFMISTVNAVYSHSNQKAF